MYVPSLASSASFASQSRRKPELNGLGAMAALLAALLLISGCTASSKNTTPTPTFTPPANTYSSAQNVTVAGTAQDTVLYCTNDGSTPTSASPQCTNPIKVSQSQTIKAIAIAPGMEPSAVAIAAYTIGASAVRPTVTAIGPATGSSAGGTGVTIVGTNFTGVTAVNFGTLQAASFVVNSATSLTAVSPAGSGAVHVTVTSTTGTSSTTSADLFTYGTAPVLTGFSPASAIVGSAGFTLTVNGSNFTSDAVVKWNSSTLTTAFVSSTQLSATVPASLLAAAASATVTVTESGGISSGMAFAINAAAPAITGISPAQGTSAGGTTVTISGTNFAAVSGVRFGAVSAASFTVNSPTSITAVAPPGSAGTVDIQIVTPSGATTPASSDQFLYLAPPAITVISPATGSSGGGTTVNINGLNLAGATSVSFGATASAGFTVNSPTSITAVSPPGSAGTVDVRVVTAGGTSSISGADQFIYVIPLPTVTGLNIAAGRIAGGTTVNITGTNFTGATAVNFGSTPAASFLVNSATSITAVSPAGSAGAVDVTVVTQYGTSAISSADQFTFSSKPIITSVSPSAGPVAGATAVTIQGANFSGATAVNFSSVQATNVSISADGSSITATSPPGNAGTVDITVVASGGSNTLSTADQFTYAPVPTVSGVLPAQGSTQGGTAVSITGTNFHGTGYTVTAVSFGGVPATGFTINSATSITATSPAGSAGVAHVVVATEGGASTSSAADQFTYVTPPAVSSISPAYGQVTGGTSVTITGTGFSGATAVNFGTMAGTIVSVSTDGTSLVATSPAGSAGGVHITVVTPFATSATSSADQFTYEPVLSGTVGSGAGTSFAAIAGAEIQLYAAGTTGYGAGTSGPTLINTEPATVITDASGNFSLMYTCPQTAGGDQIYLVATGPETGSPVVLMTALGTCGSLNTALSVTINEATTVASAYSLAQFASLGTHGILIGAPADTSTGSKCNATDNWQSTGASTCNYIGLKNAFATVQNLVDIASGAACVTTPAYSTTHSCLATTGATPVYNISYAPQARMNSLANVLAGCASPSAGASGCSTLFTNTTVGSTVPADTLQAALNIALHPASNTSQIAGLVTATPFTPVIGASDASALRDWTLALVYAGAGLGRSAAVPVALAIDASGNPWLAIENSYFVQYGGASSDAGMIAVFNNQGGPISPASTVSSPGGFRTGISNPQALAFDQNGYAWIGNYPSATTIAPGNPGSLTVMDISGSAQFGTGTTPFTNSLLLTPNPYGIAVDANNTVWVSSNTGTSQSPNCSNTSSISGGSILPLAASASTGISINGNAVDTYNDQSSCPTYLAIDRNNNLWTYDNGLTSKNDPYAKSLQIFSAGGTSVAGPYNHVNLGYQNLAIGSNGKGWIFEANTNTDATIDVISSSEISSNNSNPASQLFQNNFSNSYSWYGESAPLVLDGANQAWMVSENQNNYNSAFHKFLFETNSSNTGYLSPMDTDNTPWGFSGWDANSGTPNPIPNNAPLLALDSSGNVWLSGFVSTSTTSSVLSEFVGIGVPVQTPTVSAITGNNTPGTRP